MTRVELLLNRRAAIYRGLGTTPEAFSAATRSRALTGEEWEAKENLDALDFLLGEDEIPEAS